MGGASHKNKLETTINIKSQLTRAGRATTNKQTNIFREHHPEQGTEQVLVLENGFRKTKIIVEKSLIVRRGGTKNHD